MSRRIICVALVAATAASCATSDTQAPPVVVASPASVRASTTQSELESLRAENAQLRRQLGLAQREAAVSRDRANEITAKNTSIERGDLQPGMTVHEAHKAVTGSATLSRDTCQLVKQTNDDWVYRFRPDGAKAGPGSGGASAVGTNMRGAVPTAAVSWVCTFDARTGTLKTFRRTVD